MRREASSRVDLVGKWCRPAGPRAVDARGAARRGAALRRRDSASVSGGAPEKLANLNRERSRSLRRNEDRQQS